MQPLIIDIPDESAMASLATRLAAQVQPGDTILLEGPLGAGKTTFARHFAWALGVDRDEPITSPTFALVHEYEARVPLVHADLYRLGDAADILDLGLSERLGGDAVGLVEWGERFAPALAPVAMTIRIRAPGAHDEARREVSLIPASERGATLVANLEHGA
jgi:tRNA threonylcarbamoyladenosine biosynthesis protein TsaE